MKPSEMLASIAKAMFLADRPIDFNEVYTEVDASYFEMLAQAALQRLVEIEGKPKENIGWDLLEHCERIGQAVLGILEVENE